MANRCDGPEDVVNDQVGVLFQKEEEKSLAWAIEHVLDNIDCYNPEQLREYSLEKFARERVAHSVIDIYSEAHDCLQSSKQARMTLLTQTT